MNGLDQDEDKKGLGATRQAQYIKQYCKSKYNLRNDDFTDNICDPAMFASTSEKEGYLYSPAQFFEDEGIFLTRGYNKNRAIGAQVVFNGLDVPANSDLVPRIRFTSNCEYMIDTIPNLPTSTKGIRMGEDVDTDSEDHGFDALKYGAVEVLQDLGEKKSKQITGWRKELMNESYNDDGNYSASNSWMVM